MSQLALLFGTILPADDDGSFDDERVSFEAVTIDLTPAQARWMGRSAPTVPQCPGCVLFGCCALHDDPT